MINKILEYKTSFNVIATTMSSSKVLVSFPIPKHALDLLKERFEVIVPEQHSRELVLENVAGVDAILCAPGVMINSEVLDTAGPQLKIVATISKGYDHVDVDELKKRRIHLTNAGNVFDAVADFAVYLILAAARRGYEGRLVMERGVRQLSLGVDIKGSTVGIVGFGGIGQGIVKRLKPFNVSKFFYTGPREKEEGRKLGAQFVDFDTLVRESDFIIISCPLNSKTKFLFNAEVFSKMKPKSVLVNIARGEIVDQDAMVDALKNNKIWAVGLDVTTPEPLPVGHELLKLPNAVLMPHWAWATEGTYLAMGEMAARNIINCLQGKELLTPVYNL